MQRLNPLRLGSPNAYLSHLVIPESEAACGKFGYLPVLLGGVFKELSQTTPLAGWRQCPHQDKADNTTALETRARLQAPMHGITRYRPNRSLSQHADDLGAEPWRPGSRCLRALCRTDKV